MARYTGAACRLCRRENDKLFLKGQRCFTDRCALARRKGMPGQHPAGRRKESEYGMQLRAKQKTKRFYGLLERQFRKTFERAARMPGKAGENLLTLLELRMDNVVYRMGFADSRPQARQLVTHGHFTVNGKRLDIPSATLKEGDVVAVGETSRNIGNFENLGERIVPAWLTSDLKALTGMSCARVA